MTNSKIIETNNLSFSFKKGSKTLDNVNMSVTAGSIYGFLGPNGAGKTTTLRLLIGLLRNQHGSIKLFGQEFYQHRLEVLKKTGSLIEQPSLYQHLTAKENLEVYRGIYDCEKKRIGEVLELVDLNKTGSKKTKQFSLGMKQRLSIAVALLHNPELLILDEPTNGLDPNGIIETRELLKKMNRENGTTILVSSHLLPEVEKMASHVGIIHQGKLLFQGSLPELQLLKKKQTILEIETNDLPRTMDILKSKFEIQHSANIVLIPFKDNATNAAINKMLVEQGIDVYSIHSRHSDLEQLFMDITANNI
ncbi:MAG: ABC transporter ATP-binding protein [Chitinophagaceae bacterium]|nr:ABC transporter ATP-binding protein [Chitinophagaceae bacterium]